jgi:hypothetical protein
MFIGPVMLLLDHQLRLFAAYLAFMIHCTLASVLQDFWAHERRRFAAILSLQLPTSFLPYNSKRKIKGHARVSLEKKETR